MAGRDIDEILALIAEIHPGVERRQLKVKHPADDDGLWFFRAGGVEIQIESSTGNFPFLVESSMHADRRDVHDLHELVSVIEAELGLPVSGA